MREYYVMKIRSSHLQTQDETRRRLRINGIYCPLLSRQWFLIGLSQVAVSALHILEALALTAMGHSDSARIVQD